jgi:hypothetical protein
MRIVASIDIEIYYLIDPSLRRFSPKIDEIAIGNLKERGIGPD